MTGVTLTSLGAAATAGVAGSPYAILASGAAGSGLGNYAITYVSGALTVNRAALTVVVNNATRYFGQPNPGFTYGVTGLVNGDAASVVTGVVLTTAGSQFSAPGAYLITGSGGQAANYAITYQPGTLFVTPVPMTDAIEASQWLAPDMCTAASWLYAFDPSLPNRSVSDPLPGSDPSSGSFQEPAACPPLFSTPAPRPVAQLDSGHG